MMHPLSSRTCLVFWYVALRMTRSKSFISWLILGAVFSLNAAPRRRRTRLRVAFLGSNFELSSSIDSPSWPLRCSRVWLLERSGRSGLPRLPPAPDATEDAWGARHPALSGVGFTPDGGILGVGRCWNRRWCRCWRWDR
eukprot:9420754-Pyramimonas_sp.AAC.3